MSMSAQCINTDQLVLLQGPPEYQEEVSDAVVFSFKVAVIRSTTWRSAVFTNYNEEDAVMFQCDVLCDTKDMSDEQAGTLINDLSEIRTIMTSTLAAGVVTQYAYV